MKLSYRKFKVGINLISESDEVCTGTISSLHSGNDSSCINWNQYYSECRDGNQNPFQGTISFDNIGSAWVAIFLVSRLKQIVGRLIIRPSTPEEMAHGAPSGTFNSILSLLQVISLEGWTDIMYYIQDAHSFWDWIYFVLLIVVRISGLTFRKNICINHFSFLLDWVVFYD